MYALCIMYALFCKVCKAKFGYLKKLQGRKIQTYDAKQTKLKKCLI